MSVPSAPSASPLTPDQARAHVVATVLRHLSRGMGRRTEALEDFLAVTMPDMDERGARVLSSLVPRLPESLYGKWASMFVDRLQETVPHEHVAALCDGSDESGATLALVYVMFMESEKMERQVAEDLHALGISQQGQDDAGALLGAYLRARLTSRGQGPAN
ncbi:hypothetical protein [Nitratidesulfovibrio sp. 1201_IL3209]|uniref:hypothetical protein n=1 Tax=Nitratidesulfovibrio sp. 1201_IL3209 TaxID=3084053 RepID=UPI002FD888BD